MRSLAAATALSALAVASPAAAHVIPQPAYLAPGEHTTVSFTAPNERPPHKLVGITIAAPAGVNLADASPPLGWKLTVASRTATWSLRPAGGSTPPGPFRIVASTSLAPGTVTFHVIQRYDDGGIVRWNVAFTILPARAPAPQQHLLPAIVTAILGLVVIALLLYRARDRHQPNLGQE